MDLTGIPLPLANIFGGTGLIIILVIVVLLFGGKKIPELMRGVGKGVGELQKGLDEGRKAAGKDEEPHPTPEKTA